MARTQIRLALVIEGGVSLAVWMSGVVQEVDALRRAGSPGREPIPEGPDAGSVAGWRELCDRLDLDVVVDVVAGTSAGGLNGAVLACAAAAGRPMPKLKDLWLDRAQLTRGKLLREPGHEPVDSLLDGRYFEDCLRPVIMEALTGTPGTSSLPVTLLTTATALGSQCQDWVDSAGARFEVADHRRVYRFRQNPAGLVYRPPTSTGETVNLADLFTTEPSTDLAPAAAGTIARAARATAGFPGAFEPVPERDATIDLTRYSVMKVASPAPLADGGILDNTPFEPLLEEISRREVDEDWRRVIGYIVANDALASSAAAAPAPASTREATSESQPGWFPVLASALRTPMETSFRQGVEDLAERSLDVERLIRVPQQLFAAVLSGRGPDASALASLYPMYRQSRLASGVVDAYLLQTQGAPAQSVTLPKFAYGSPDAASQWVPNADLDAAMNATDFCWGSAVADHIVRLLLRQTQSMARPDDDDNRRRSITTALARVSHTAAAIAAVRDRVETEIKKGPATTDADRLARIVDDAVRGIRAPEVLQALVVDACTAYADLLGTTPDPSIAPGPPDAGAASAPAALTPTQVLQALLAVEILTRATAGPVPFQRAVRFDLLRMGPDTENYVVQPLRGADGKLRPLGEWKLYGIQLAHFGAFGKREWRLNDYIWGRLDGAAHLVNVLAQARRQSPAGAAFDEAAQKVATETAQRAVLAEEQVPVAALQTAMQELNGLTAQKALDIVRSTDAGRQTAEDGVASALRMLRDLNPTNPRIVREAGGWLSAALAGDDTVQTDLTWTQKILRQVVEPIHYFGINLGLRERFWHWVRTPESKGDATPGP